MARVEDGWFSSSVGGAELQMRRGIEAKSKIIFYAPAIKWRKSI